MNQGCCSTECHIRNLEAGWSTEKPSHLPTDLRSDLLSSKISFGKEKIQIFYLLNFSIYFVLALFQRRSIQSKNGGDYRAL